MARQKKQKLTPVERSKQTAEQILLDYFGHVAEPDMNAPIVSDPLRVAVAKFTSEMAEDFAGNDELIAKFLESHGLDVIADPNSNAATRLDVAKLAAKVKTNIERQKAEGATVTITIGPKDRPMLVINKMPVKLTPGYEGTPGDFRDGEWAPGTTEADKRRVFGVKKK
jgi:hypothetical protein